MTASIRALRVQRIIEHWDMRGVHKLRRAKTTTNLKRGECVVAFNRKMTIGRLIDSTGGVHTYYAEDKEVFDMEAISRLVDTGFWIEVKTAKHVVTEKTNGKKKRKAA